MAIELNNDINENWNGHTGEDVERAIKGLFLTNINAINNSIKDITFTEDPNNSSKINVLITKHAGEPIPVSFSVTPKSEKKVHLTSLTSTDYVSPGENLEVKYGFKVIDDSGSELGGYRVTPKILVNNNPVLGIPQSVGTSNFNTERIETITIPAYYLNNGINMITVDKLLTKDKEDSSELGFEVENDNELKVYCISLELDCNLKYKSSEEYYNLSLVPSLNTELVLSLILKSGTNDLLTSAYNDLDIKCRLIGSENPLYRPTTSYSEKSINSNANTIEFTLGGLNEGYNITTETQQIFVLAYLVRNGVEVSSNIVKFQVVIDNNLVDNKVYYVYKLVGACDSSGRSLPSYTNFIKVNLYDNYNFEYYAYSLLAITLEHRMGSDSLSSESISGYTITYVARTVKIDFEQNRTFTVKKQSDNVNGLEIQVIPVRLGGSTIKPAGAILDLSTNGTSENTTWNGVTYLNFNGLTNGYIDNSLVFSDNASITFNNFSPCSTLGEHSISFRFKTSNESFENEELIKCFSQNADGFIIYPQKAVIYNGGSSKETYFSSLDSIKEITFVWYGSFYNNYSIIYVNGTAQMINTKSRVINNNNLVITANKSILSLYRVIAYNRALTFKEVLNLYATENLNSEDINNYTIKNNIFSKEITNTEYNGNKVTIDSLPVGSTYMLIKAHPLGQDRPWEVINKLGPYLNVNGENVLTKSLRILVGPIYLIKKVAANQPADSFNFYADKATFSAQGTSSMNYDIKNFRIYFNKKISLVNSEGFDDCYEGYSDGVNWSNSPVDGYTQYREGAFGKTSKLIIGSSVVSHNSIPSGNSVSPKLYSMHSNSIPANIFCLKADIAESSGVHNTGFARMANYAMEESDTIKNNEKSEIPQNRVYSLNDSEPTYQSRLTVDGFPIYLFFADKAGNIYYHGKYNFNNEKATAEVFGFTPFESTAYFEHDTVKNQVNLLKPYFGLSPNDTSLEETHATYTDANNEEVCNMIECWEFSTNRIEEGKIKGLSALQEGYEMAAEIAAFCYPYTDESDTDYTLNQARWPYGNAGLAYLNKNPFTVEAVSTNTKAWINTENAWEYRFPDWETKSGEEDTAYIKHRDGIILPHLLKSLYKWVHRHSYYLWENVAHDTQTGIAMVEEFANYLDLYFNVNNLLKYYVLTKWFVCSDQRIKNCMLSFYCDPEAEFNDGNQTYNSGSPMGNMRAYFLFYDNDTILGLTNEGKLQLPWDAKENGNNFLGYDSLNKSYNGIWCNLEHCYNDYMYGTGTPATRNLGKLIVDAYISLRKKLTDNVIDFFLDGVNAVDPNSLSGLPDTTSYLPDSASNIDMEVKYMYPKVLVPNGTNFKDFACDYLFQGNRKYHRERFIRKRTLWFDSLFGGELTLEAYNFSILAAKATVPLYSDSVKFKCALDELRFYCRTGDDAAYYPISDTTNNLKTILNLNSEVEKHIGKNIINSNGIYFVGLYACKEIDLSGLNGAFTENAYENAFQPYIFPRPKPLLYVEKITIGTTQKANVNGELKTIKSYYTPDFLNWMFDSTFVPNVLTIIVNNVETNTVETIVNPQTNEEEIKSTKFDKLYLSGLNNLESLTLDAYINGIELPSLDSLTTVSIKKLAGSLTLENSFKLTPGNITINDVTELSSIVLTNCSIPLYIWALDYSDSKSVTINFGWVKGRQTIDQLLAVLNTFEDEDFANVTLSGYADYENSSYGALVTRLNNRYSSNHLSIISKSNIEGERIDTNGNQSISEGDQILLTAVDFKVISVNNDYKWELVSNSLSSGQLSQLLLIEKSDTTCKLKANATNNNTGFTGTVEVRAYKSLNEYISFSLNVNYISIKEIRLNSDLLILDGGSGQYSSTELDITLLSSSGMNTTKSYLLQDSNKWTLSNCQLNDGVLIASIVNSQDTIATISLTEDSRISGSFELYYNLELPNSNSESNVRNSNYPWIADLIGLTGFTLANGGYLTRRFLNSFLIKTSNNTISAYTSENVLCGSILRGESKEGYDLSILNYFKNYDSKFTVPSAFDFNAIKIPDGFTEVEWTSVNDRADANSYTRFTFPKTVTKVRVELQNLNILYTSLVFDISRTNIDKIYPYTSDSLTNVFYLKMSMSDGHAPASKGGILFDYNQAVDYKKIGNYKETLQEVLDLSAETAIFSLPHYRGTTNATYPFYTFGNVPNSTGDLYIGYMTDYICLDTIFNWGLIAGKVKGLYGTFTADYPTDSLTFTNLEYIGNLAFAFKGYANHELTQLSFVYTFPKCNSMKTMGSYAFQGFNGIIAAPSILGIAEFKALQTIPTCAFANFKNQHTFKFEAVTTIKPLAFLETLFGHNIYIDNEYNMTLPSASSTSNPFQDPDKNVLYARNKSRFSNYFNNENNLIELV